MSGVTRIGLIGCGKWGRLVLRDLLALDAAVWVVATGQDAEAAAAAGAQPVASVQQLPDVDGIVVVTPTSTHADVIDRCWGAASDLLRKPLCDDAERARRLAAADSTGSSSWTSGATTAACANGPIARSGELGPVVGLRTCRVGYGHDHADTDCVWTLLPHELSIGLEILGGLLPPRHALADRANGTVMGLVASCADDGGPWHVMEVGIRAPRRQRTVTLLCANGSAILEDAYADTILIVDNPDGPGTTEPRTRRRPIPVEMPLLAELAAFLAHLRVGRAKSSVAEAARPWTVALRRLAGI